MLYPNQLWHNCAIDQCLCLNCLNVTVNKDKCVVFFQILITDTFFLYCNEPHHEKDASVNLYEFSSAA